MKITEGYGGGIWIINNRCGIGLKHSKTKACKQGKCKFITCLDL